MTTPQDRAREWMDANGREAWPGRIESLATLILEAEKRMQERCAAICDADAHEYGNREVSTTAQPEKGMYGMAMSEARYLAGRIRALTDEPLKDDPDHGKA